MTALPMRATAKNRVRVIGGLWRSRLIAFPARPELRPTPDRVRETLFNWLGQDLTGRDCLDLFAGSGALGFEAASRGARRVVMIERDAQTFAALKDKARRLQAQSVEVRFGDALEFLRADRGHYDIVLLDPPFGADYLPKVLAMLPPRLGPDALVYSEAPRAPELPAGWEIRRSSRAGAVAYQLLKWTGHGG